MNINYLLTQLQRYTMMESAEDEHIERLTVKAQGVGAIRYDKEKLQTQPAQDRNETATIELIKAKEKAADRRRRRLKLRMQAFGLFGQYLTPNQAFIMDLIYIQGFSVQDVADATGLSISWIYDIKKQSVDNLCKEMLAEFNPGNYDKVGKQDNKNS